MVSTKNKDGFTLIELTIVITIIGIFIGAFAQGATVYVKKAKNEQLAEKVSDLQKSLYDFIHADADGDPLTPERIGRYPCPAPLTAKPSDPEYGVEQRDAVAGTCTVVPGITEATGTDGQKVYIGTVPTTTLQVESDHMLDPWKQRFVYAISASLTGNGEPVLKMRPIGAITIEKGDDQGVITNVTTRAHFVVVSHGVDHAGAYTATGAAHSNACRIGEAGDTENCDNDAVFSDLYRVEAQSADHYDDKIAFTLKNVDDDTLWAESPANPADIYNVNTGNVGIGTDSPEGQLHVHHDAINSTDLHLSNTNSGTGPSDGLFLSMGSNGQDAVLTNKENGFLHFRTNNNNRASITPTGDVGIGTTASTQKLDVAGNIKASGTIMLNAMCPSGKMLRGVSNGSPVCVSPPAPTTSIPGGTCPGGQFMIGMNANGTPQCSSAGTQAGAPCTVTYSTPTSHYWPRPQSGVTIKYMDSATPGGAGRCCLLSGNPNSGEGPYCVNF